MIGIPKHKCGYRCVHGTARQRGELQMKHNKRMNSGWQFLRFIASRLCEAFSRLQQPNVRLEPTGPRPAAQPQNPLFLENLTWQFYFSSLEYLKEPFRQFGFIQSRSLFR